MLAGSGLITTRNECGEGGSTSGLGNYPQCLPKSQLGTLDRVVRNQDYVVHMLLGDGVHERADAAGCERIRRYATSRGVDWSSCLERHRQRWGGFGLDPTTLTLPPNQAAIPAISRHLRPRQGACRDRDSAPRSPARLSPGLRAFHARRRRGSRAHLIALPRPQPRRERRRSGHP